MPISGGTQVWLSTWNWVTGYAGIIFAQRIYSNLFWFKLTMLVSGFAGCIDCTTVIAHSGMPFVFKFIRIQPSKTYSCRRSEFVIALLVASKCQQCIRAARRASRSRVMEKENVWLEDSMWFCCCYWLELASTDSCWYSVDSLSDL